MTFRRASVSRKLQQKWLQGGGKHEKHREENVAEATTHYTVQDTVEKGGDAR